MPSRSPIRRRRVQSHRWTTCTQRSARRWSWKRKSLRPSFPPPSLSCSSSCSVCLRKAYKPTWRPLCIAPWTPTLPSWDSRGTIQRRIPPALHFSACCTSRAAPHCSSWQISRRSTCAVPVSQRAQRHTPVAASMGSFPSPPRMQRRCLATTTTVRHSLQPRAALFSAPCWTRASKSYSRRIWTMCATWTESVAS